MIKKLKLSLALCLVAISLSVNAFAQQPAAPTAAPTTSSAATAEAQLLRALLEEVRQLRATVQHLSVINYRAQRFAEQLARQQNRVDSLTEELAQVKTQIQQALDTSRDEEELRRLEADIANAPNPQMRAQLEQVYASLKTSIERQREYTRQEAERNRARQQQLEVALQTEQGRLAEVRDHLDALDRDFDRQLGDGKKGKP